MSDSCDCRYTRLICECNCERKSCKGEFKWIWLKCDEFLRHAILPAKQRVPDSRASEARPRYCPNCEKHRAQEREQEGRANDRLMPSQGNQQSHLFGARPGYYTSYSYETVLTRSSRSSRETVDASSQFERESPSEVIELAELDQDQRVNSSSQLKRDSDSGYRKGQTGTAQPSRHSENHDRHRSHRSERRDEPLSHPAIVNDSVEVQPNERKYGGPTGATGVTVIQGPAHKLRNVPPTSSGTQIHPQSARFASGPSQTTPQQRAALRGNRPPNISGSVIAGGNAGPSRGNATLDADDPNEEFERGASESIQHGDDVMEEAGPVSTRPGEYIEVVEEITASSDSSSTERRYRAPDSTSTSSSSSVRPGPSRTAAISTPIVLQGHLRTSSTSSSSSPSASSSSPSCCSSSSARRSMSQAEAASVSTATRVQQSGMRVATRGRSSSAQPSSSRVAGNYVSGDDTVLLGRAPRQALDRPASSPSLPPTISSDSAQPEDEPRRAITSSRERPPPARSAMRSREPHREQPAPVRPALQTPNPFAPLGSGPPSTAGQSTTSTGPSRPSERRENIGEDAQVRLAVNLPSSSSSRSRERRRH